MLRAICRHPSRTGLQRCLILTSVKTGFPSLPTLVNAKTKRLLIRADEQIHDFETPGDERLYREWEEEESAGIKSVSSGRCAMSREIVEVGSKTKSRWGDLFTCHQSTY